MPLAGRQHDGRDPGRLFRGTHLAVAQDWAAEHGQALNADEQAFLAASKHDQLRGTRRRQAAVAGLATLAAITFAGIAVRYGRVAAHSAANATRQHDIALSRQLAAEAIALDPTDPITARRLAVAAWRASPTVQAGSAITTLLTEEHTMASCTPPKPRHMRRRSAPTASSWPPRTARTARCGYGIQPPAWVSAHLCKRAVFFVTDAAFSPAGSLLASAESMHGTAVGSGHRPPRRRTASCPGRKQYSL